MLRQVVLGRSDQIDGVEGHVLFPAGLIAAAAAKLHRVPLILYAHGSDVAVSAHRSPVHRLMARLTARSAAAVITNAAGTAELVAHLGVTATVVPPGVDFDRFKPGDRIAARQGLGLPETGLIAIFIGRLEARKGPDVFAEAVTRSADWSGIIVGDGPLRDLVRLNWPRIRVVDPIPHREVPQWMRAADVVVVPSRREPLGLAAIEALACGVPVIASRVGGLAETVVDGLNGFLVEPDNSGAIKAALNELASSKLRERLGLAARESVAIHDVRVTSERMAEIWHAVGSRER
jgi:glycosyltransferase involved in cell wall biosynthesis